MSVKQIIKESMDRNPMNMKEALQEELRVRVGRVMEERIKNLSEASFEVGDKVKHPKDHPSGEGSIGTVKEVRGSGKDLVVSVDFGNGVVDLLPNSGDKMDKLVKESLEEAVEVGYDRYKRSHGSKPGAQSGLWMFTNKRSGSPDFDDDTEVFEYNGSRKEAEKAAKKWAKSNGYRSVFVMESNDNSRSLRESYWEVSMPIDNPDKTGKTIYDKAHSYDYDDIGWDKDGMFTATFDNEKEANKFSLFLRKYKHSSKNQQPKVKEIKEGLNESASKS